jgi:hypothetical protein
VVVVGVDVVYGVGYVLVVVPPVDLVAEGLPDGVALEFVFAVEDELSFNRK